MAILVLLNNFLHDFSAAGWLFCTVLLWAVFRRGELDVGVRGVIKIILLLMRVSLGGIIVFGIVRALAYKSYEWSAAAGKGQVPLLVVKHVILLAVFCLGVVYYGRGKKAVSNVVREKR